MEPWRKAPLLFVASLAPPALWLAVFFLLPLSLLWAYSFGEKTGITGIDLDWTLANYARALDPLYFGILIKSLWIAGAATLICLIVGLPVALAISFAPARVQPWLLLLIILPFWTNLLIRTYALIAVLRGNGHVNSTLEWLWGIGNGFLGLIGFGGHQLLGSGFTPLQLLYNDGAVVTGLVYVHLPFMVLPLYAALDRLDRSLIEASLDLGAGHVRTFFTIIAPLALPGIVSGIIITFIPALGAYLTPDLLGGSDSQMIANVIERQFKSANDWPFGAALSFLLMYITFFGLAMRSLLSNGRGDAA
ncbi:MAG TPA: ABC transporter permease [Alphaproteobacteria bacterium]|nr:ABC transporter permease [Alphaproteobacteria bacterium]